VKHTNSLRDRSDGGRRSGAAWNARRPGGAAGAATPPPQQQLRRGRDWQPLRALRLQHGVVCDGTAKLNVMSVI